MEFMTTAILVKTNITKACNNKYGKINLIESLTLILNSLNLIYNITENL